MSTETHGLPTEQEQSATTYAGLLRSVAAARPDAVALAFPGRRLTYRELVDRGAARAKELRALGVGRGDRFGMLLPNCPELVELLIGGAMIGAAAVPINTRFKSVELEHVCVDGALKALFTTDAVDDHVDFKALLWEALPGLKEAPDPQRLALPRAPELGAVALVSEREAPGLLAAHALRDLAAGQPEVTPDDAPDGDDPLLIMYTSGTTAKPKGCLQTNVAVVTNTGNIAERFAIPAGDRWWDPLPMFHMGAILLMTAVFHRGGTFISQGHFDADEAFDLIEEHRPTVLYPLFPTITLSLLHHPRFAQATLEQVRVITNVSPPDIQRQIQDALPGATLISAYGMTELCGTLAYSRLDDTLEQRTTTCGHLLPGWEAKIIDPETGATVAPDVRGELVVRGDCLFAGYFNDPGQTAASIDADGYFHTGDHCSLDADGLLLFHGRLKDVLKVGGENVSALEVESFLATQPGVKLAQVVGVPDDKYDEVAAAFIELAPGARLTEREVKDFCNGRIARFKIPRYVRFVTEWPMSSTKVQKFRLRDTLMAELGRDA
ncbi:MAG TPA: AMP-binding protein [Baekduia sp.]